MAGKDPLAPCLSPLAPLNGYKVVMRFFLSIFITGMASVASAADVDFNRDVRPILSARCFKCHGPDDKARKAKLRLDREESAKAAATSGETPIVPGKPDESEVVRRIYAVEPEERMPPPAASSRLSEAERR